MKILKFEGTPEEFKVVADLFGETSTIGDGTLDQTYIEPVNAIRKMLTRIPVSAGQKTVYQALSNGPLTYSELLEITNMDTRSMAGVMGAIGRRISNTREIRQAGLHGNTKAIFVWHQDGDIKHISLSPDALEALREENIV